MDEEIIIETLDRVEQELHNIRVEIHNLNKKLRTATNNTFVTSTGTNYLSIKDLCKFCSCGDTKARKIMAMLPHVRIGKQQYVLLQDLQKYIKENNGIVVHW
ncbi:MAG: hypothetical protein Q4E88_06845 [Coriobacteriia bacterium]|nr:hypothetical protein [Coriobacteriia bacterium]